jgi:hypothetical protein
MVHYFPPQNNGANPPRIVGRSASASDVDRTGGLSLLRAQALRHLVIEMPGNL